MVTWPGYRRLVVLIALLAMPALATAAPCSLRATASRVALGKPLDLEITQPGRTRWDELDLSALAQDFVVASRQVDDGHRPVLLRLRLYPLRPGPVRLSVPACAQGTAAMTVTVTAAEDDRDHTPIRVHTRVSTGAPWLKQAVRVEMTVDAATPYAGLDIEPFTSDDLEVRRLPVQTTVDAGRGALPVRHRVTWVLRALRAGAVAVRLPALKYRRGGVVSHRFYAPLTLLQVKPLPDYVPVTLPVGSVNIDLRAPDAWLLRAGHLSFFTIDFSGDGVSEDTAQELLRRFSAGASLRWYPPRPLPVSATDDARLRWQLPMLPATQGILALPSLRIQYFDPDSGKLVTRRSRPGRILVVSTGLLVVTAVLLGLLGMLAAFRAARAVTAYRRRVRAYCRALDIIQRARTPQRLRAALVDIAVAEAWPGNLTLTAWLERWRQDHPRYQALLAGIAVLQGQLYGGAATALDEPRAALLALCHRRMPLLKYLAVKPDGVKHT